LLRDLAIRHFLVLTEANQRGRELPSSRINKFPYGNQKPARAGHMDRRVASFNISRKFPYSNLGLQTAPETG
jgi:hypothetical protein